MNARDEASADFRVAMVAAREAYDRAISAAAAARLTAERRAADVLQRAIDAERTAEHARRGEYDALARTDTDDLLRLLGRLRITQGDHYRAYMSAERQETSRRRIRLAREILTARGVTIPAGL